MNQKTGTDVYTDLIGHVIDEKTETPEMTSLMLSQFVYGHVDREMHDQICDRIQKIYGCASGPRLPAGIRVMTVVSPLDQRVVIENLYFIQPGEFTRICEMGDFTNKYDLLDKGMSSYQAAMTNYRTSKAQAGAAPKVDPFQEDRLFRDLSESMLKDTHDFYARQSPEDKDAMQSGYHNRGSFYCEFVVANLPIHGQQVCITTMAIARMLQYLNKEPLDIKKFHLAFALTIRTQLPHLHDDGQAAAVFFKDEDGSEAAGVCLSAVGYVQVSQFLGLSEPINMWAKLGFISALASYDNILETSSLDATKAVIAKMQTK